MPKRMQPRMLQLPVFAGTKIIIPSVGRWRFDLSLNVSLLDASLLEMPTNDLCLSLRMSVHFPGPLQFVLSLPTCSSNF